LAVIVVNAQKDACMLTNPRTANHAQVVEIFKATL
ncbi:iron-containing alcohol dehydrogenase, partial [Acinetobacter baumannii]